MKGDRGEEPGLDLVDGALGGPEVRGLGRGEVEGLRLAVETGALGGHRKAAPAGGDDLRDELLAVHAHLHGGPVLRKLPGELRLLQRPPLPAALLGQPGGEQGVNRLQLGEHH